jgi:hypothetical protein
MQRFMRKRWWVCKNLYSLQKNALPAEGDCKQISNESARKKEMTLDCPSIDASRVISLGSWVQSLVNLLFCGLALLSVTKI